MLVRGAPEVASGGLRGKLRLVNVPETRYAMSGDVSIAYQVVGTRPVDLVLVPGFVSNVELAWDDPHSVTFYRALAECSRLIVFDKRGTGLSDRVTGVAPLEVRMDDLRAVMDAAGSERAAVIGFSEGAPMATLFAATYPERVTAIILCGGRARYTRAPDYPFGPSEAEYRREVEDTRARFGDAGVGRRGNCRTRAEHDRRRGIQGVLCPLHAAER